MRWQALHCIFLVPFVTIALSLAGCGGGDDSASPPPPPVSDPVPPPNESLISPIPTTSAASTDYEGATVVSGIDSSNVHIQVFVESDLAAGVEMSEGLDLGLPDTYLPITSGFIEIALPEQVQGKRLLRIVSPPAFESIIAKGGGNTALAVVPFFTLADGSVEFQLAPIDGVITFALMDVPDF